MEFVYDIMEFVYDIMEFIYDIMEFCGKGFIYDTMEFYLRYNGVFGLWVICRRQNSFPDSLAFVDIYGNYPWRIIVPANI